MSEIPFPTGLAQSPLGNILSTGRLTLDQDEWNRVKADTGMDDHDLYLFQYYKVNERYYAPANPHPELYKGNINFTVYYDIVLKQQPGEENVLYDDPLRYLMYKFCEETNDELFNKAPKNLADLMANATIG